MLQPSSQYLSCGKEKNRVTTGPTRMGCLTANLAEAENVEMEDDHLELAEA